MVRFEYSKDFKNWVSQIDGRSIEEYTVLGSFDIRQGYNLSEEPRASTFSMQIVSDYDLAKALLEYRYIRVSKDDGIAFIGKLTLDSSRKIETLSQQVLTIKYIHLLDWFEDREFWWEGDYAIVEKDGYKVLDPNDKHHSLVHEIISQFLIPSWDDNPFGFIFDDRGFSNLTPVIRFSMHKGDKLWRVLNDLLREYGYVIRIENTTLYLVDVLDDSQKGIELLDGADIEVQTTDEPLTIPDVLYLDSVTDYGTTVYKGEDSYSGFLSNFVIAKDLPFTFEREGDKVKVIDVSNVEYDNSRLAYTWWGKSYVNEDRRSFHRIIQRPPFSLYQPFSETVTADVTYAVYAHAVTSLKVPNGFTYDRSEVIEPRYLYTKEQVERYIKTYARIKLFKHASWTFFSKVKLNVDDIVRFRDIPDSTCRIYEVQDTLEKDGGYTYKAFPFPEQDLEFDVREETPSVTLQDRIVTIAPKESIFIENGAYRLPKWRIYVKTALALNPPTVKVDNVPHEVGWDGNESRWFVDVELTDLDKTSLEVFAALGDATLTTIIPIYKTDSRPTIIEYRYSTSDTDPLADDFRLYYGEFALKYGDYFLGGAAEPWTADIPVGAKYDYLFLWRRTWSYTLNDWVYEMISPIEKSFRLAASSDIFVINRRNTVETRISIRAVIKGYKGRIADEGITTTAGRLERVDDTLWTLILAPEEDARTIDITATLGNETTSIVINGIVKESVPVYGGILAAPPAPEGLIEGDFYLTEEGVPMRWDGTQWLETTKADDNYSQIMEIGARDWLKKGKPLKVAAALYAYFGDLYADNITTHEMTLTENGAIKSSDYDPIMPETQRTGFIIKHDGYSEFNDTTIRGDLRNDESIDPTEPDSPYREGVKVIKRRASIEWDYEDFYASEESLPDTPALFGGLRVLPQYEIEDKLAQNVVVFNSDCQISYPFMYMDTPRTSLHPAPWKYFIWKKFETDVEGQMTLYGVDGSKFETRGKRFYAVSLNKTTHILRNGNENRWKAFDGFWFSHAFPLNAQSRLGSQGKPVNKIYGYDATFYNDLKCYGDASYNILRADTLLLGNGSWEKRFTMLPNGVLLKFGEHIGQVKDGWQDFFFDKTIQFAEPPIVVTTKENTGSTSNGWNYVQNVTVDGFRGLTFKGKMFYYIAVGKAKIL